MSEDELGNLRIWYSSVKYDAQNYGACENINKIKCSVRNDHIETNRQWSVNSMDRPDKSPGLTTNLRYSNAGLNKFNPGFEQYLRIPAPVLYWLQAPSVNQTSPFLSWLDQFFLHSSLVGITTRHILKVHHRDTIIVRINKSHYIS